MTEQPETTSDDDTLLEEASGWFLRLRLAVGGEGDEPEAVVRAALAEWLAASPDHRAVYHEVERTWSAVSESASAPEIMVNRHDALRRVRGAVRRRWALGGLSRSAAAAVFLLFATATTLAWMGQRFFSESVYETAMGETRVITLADGSRIALDGQTRIAVSYTDDARNVGLLRGQAQFEVAKDRARPFRVTAGDQTIVAVGTAFNVELLDNRVLVTLIEGRVAITPAETQSASTSERGKSPTETAARTAPKHRELRSGQQLVVTEQSGVSELKEVNVENTIAWRSGKLVFKNEPLSTAVVRMNRQAARERLKIADPSIAAIGISGIFNAGDQDAFVDALAHYFPVRAIPGRDGTIELHGVD